MKTVHLTSTSQIKVDSLLEVMPAGREATVIKTHDCSTPIEQPFGWSTIMDMATLRVRTLQDKPALENFQIFSIENGIIFENDKYWDVCYVLLLASPAGSGLGKSCPVDFRVEFPKEAVLEAQRRDFDKTTVGSVLAEMYPGLNKKDPHSFLTGGKITRKDQFVASLKQFPSYVFR